MQSFKSFLSEQKNTHMTHLEDKVIYGGVDGTRQAINALRGMRDMLAGYKEGSVSVKWDGAPAVFAGTDPRDGQFFVAKKGIFNKEPKVYKTNADIDADTSGDLNVKLKQALKYLPDLGIKGVVQGDFLFSRADLATKKIHGEKYVTFHPNTIVYAVPHHEAAPLLKSKMGIVWHTSYTGSSFETMKASYGVDVSRFRKTKNVWSQDAMLRDLRTATMSADDTAEVDKYLKQAGKIFQDIRGDVLRELESNQELAQHIETYNNLYVRKGVVITNTKQHVERLIQWIKAKYNKMMNTRKTDKGKNTVMQKLQKLLDFFSVKNRVALKKLFDLQKLLVLAKLKLINKLNNLSKLGTFVKTRKGYKVTGAEGFVAIDTLGGDAVKLVDRMEFSFNNFSPTVLKGWDTPSRS
jgi:hypothetical protein